MVSIVSQPLLPSSSVQPQKAVPVQAQDARTADVNAAKDAKLMSPATVITTRTDKPAIDSQPAPKAVAKSEPNSKKMVTSYVDANGVEVEVVPAPFVTSRYASEQKGMDVDQASIDAAEGVEV